MTKKGFTLVELLATIVIIAFIMGIVLPSATRISKENQNKMCEAYQDMMVEYAQASKYRNKFYIDLDELDELSDVIKDCDGYVTIDYEGEKPVYKAFISCENECHTEEFVEADSRTNRRTILTPYPQCLTNVIYNGKSQYIVARGAGYTLENAQRINVGKQNVTAYIADKNVYAWGDKTQGPVTIRDCEVKKREIKLKAKDYTFQYGSTPAALQYDLSNRITVNGKTENPLSSTVSFTLKDSSNKTVTYSNRLPAGTYTIIPSAEAKSNYYITPQNGVLTVTQKPLIPTVTASNKTYNGNTTATCSTTATLSGIESGDTVSATVNAQGVFDNKNVGTGKTVTCSGITLTGASAGNYSVPSSATTTANITAKQLTASMTNCGKVYNGNTTAPCTVVYTNVESVDSVSAGATCTFANKTVGTNKTVTCKSFTKSGTGNGNYIVPTDGKTTTANITSKALTAATPTGCGKVYNQNTTAPCTTGVNGIVGGDAVSVSATCTYADKTVGTNKTVTCKSYSISGTDSGNYTAPSGNKTTTANITAKALTANTPSCSNKTYNNSRAASCTLTFNGVINGDTVTPGYTCTFDNVNVGTGKTVTCTSFTISGTDSGNYTAPTGSKTTTANITAQKCNAPTNVSISAAGAVTWTASSNCSTAQHQVKVASGTYGNASSGVNKKTDITAATGSRTVYVKAVAPSTNYNDSDASSASTTVFSVSLSKGTGIASVSGGGNYINGSSASISATTSSGFRFVNWTGTSTITTNPSSVTVNGNKSYTANAVANTLNVEVTPYYGEKDGAEHYATIKVTSAGWDGQTIVSGTSTSYGTTVTSSGSVNTPYNLKPGQVDKGTTTIYYRVTGGTYYSDLTGSTTITIIEPYPCYVSSYDYRETSYCRDHGIIGDMACCEDDCPHKYNDYKNQGAMESWCEPRGDYAMALCIIKWRDRSYSSGICPWNPSGGGGESGGGTTGCNCGGCWQNITCYEGQTSQTQTECAKHNNKWACNQCYTSERTCYE